MFSDFSRYDPETTSRLNRGQWLDDARSRRLSAGLWAALYYACALLGVGGSGG